MRPFNETKILWRNFVTSIMTSPSKKREHSQTACGLDHDSMRPELPIEPGCCNPVYSKCSSVDLLSDDGLMEELPSNLEELEPNEENFELLVAECDKLRKEKARMQMSMFELDRQMEGVVLDCDRVVKESNFRFKQAIKSLTHMQSTILCLRQEKNIQARNAAKAVADRNVMELQLEAAKKEIKKLKRNPYSRNKEVNQVARVPEMLATPRNR